MPNRTQIVIAVLVILHLVGIAGFVWNIHPAFVMLTPVNLLLSLGLVLWLHSLRDQRFWLLCGLTFLLGFGIEVVGVQTGWPFGVYWYEDVLGPKLWATPLMIGVNWLMLVYITAAAVDAIPLRLTRWFQAALSATLMTGLDVVIEPVAIQFDFWEWAQPQVPLSNYIAWWLISFALQLLWQYAVPPIRNRATVVLLLCQLGFFLGVGWMAS